ncbi:MAG: dUTP diphosphatase [Patescibacteria group bacterium]
MEVKIHRLDPTLPLPEYHSPGAAAFDLASRLDMTVAPKTVALIPTNIIIAIPDGYVLIAVPRSGTPRKKGLSSPHGIGIIDRDYCGPTDELMLQVYNFTDQPVVVARGERIGQAMIVPVVTAEWVEGEPTAPTRGGFGSTG